MAEMLTIPENHKLLLTAEKAAEILSLSIPTVRRRMKDGTFPVVRIAGNVRIPYHSLVELIERENS